MRIFRIFELVWHISHSLQVGIREVKVSSSSWHQHGCACLHACLVVHKPLSVGGKADHVPLACCLKERQKIGNKG